MKTYIDETGKHVSYKPNRFQIGIDLLGKPIFNDSWIFSKNTRIYGNGNTYENTYIVHCYETMSSYIDSCVVISYDDIYSFNFNGKNKEWYSDYDGSHSYMFDYFNTKYYYIKFKTIDYVLLSNNNQ